MINVVRPPLPEQCRIICVSDIHTHWRELELLLGQCAYKAGEDFLFILGDILERGEDNIAALKYVMELAKAPRVIVIGGNNDTYVTGLALRYDDEKFLQRFSAKPNCCFGEMAKTLGITDFSEDTAAKRRMVYEAYKEEIDFVHALPDAIETEEYIFVHAGLEGRNWTEMKDFRHMLIPRFIDRENPTDKTIVCGHFPTYALGRSNSNRVIFDTERRIIDIDGGIGVKPAGQLNALCISKAGGEYYYFDSEFIPAPKFRRAVASCKGREDWIFADYERHQFEKTGGECENGFVEVRNISTGEVGIVPENMCGEWDSTLHAWGNLNAFVCVGEGERVWVFSEHGDYFWCVNALGEVGSVPKKVIGD